MIKKISAIVLAIVLCLSVVVVPASALELADGMNISFELKWDKEYYAAGETATLSVFMKCSEDLQLGTGSLMFAFDSSVIDTSVDPELISSDFWTSFWKDAANSAGWFTTTTILNKVTTANTADENSLYDSYYKIVISRDTANGTHENATDLKYGLPGADINALADAGEPILQMVYTVASDVADSTAMKAAITTGSVACSPAQTAFKYIKTPGKSTTANVAASTFDVTSAVADATIGAATSTYTVTYKDGNTVLKTFADVEEGSATPTIANPTKAGYIFNGWSPAVAATVTADAEYVAQWTKLLDLGDANREQIKFDKKADGTYAGTFAYRTFVELANFDEIFGNVAGATDEADGTYLVDAGYVVTAGTLDVAGAKAYVEGTGALPSGHVADDTTYISTSFISGKYVMALTVKNIPDASKTATLGGLAYIKYMLNGEEQIAYYDITSDSFEVLYDTYFDKAFPNG